MSLELKSEELALIISALEGDRIGTWADTRHERIKSLLFKLKTERGKL